MNHDLHFRITEKNLNELSDISEKLKMKTISKTIVAIFNQISPILEKYQIEFQNRKSNYKIISSLKEKRRNIHAYIPESMYRQLKDLHQYLNFYSLAQIIREIIAIYLRDYFCKGIKKVTMKYNKIKKEWEIKKALMKGKEFLRQLSLYYPLKQAITVKYDNNYNPYSLIFH